MSEHALSRRSFALGGLALVLGGNATLSTRVAAQDATVVAGGGDLSSLGLPTLDITVTADGFDGAPSDDIEAGRYLITATIADGLEYAAAAFMSPPPDMTAEEFLAAVSGGGAPPTGMESSPSAMAEGSPAAGGEEGGGEEMEMLPLFVYKATFAGGVGAPGGTTGQAIINLTPGEWILWGDSPEASQPPMIFNVTGDMPADLPEPNADITITMIDFAIAVEGSLTAGDHMVEVVNNGAQPHFVAIMKGPDTMTNDDIAAILSAEMGMEQGGTPPALPFDPDKDMMPIAETITQSIGTTQWMPMSFEAGTYAAICFFPTAGEGAPHAAHGMYIVFTVQ